MPVVWQAWREEEEELAGKGLWAVAFSTGWKERGSFLTNVLY